MCTCVCWKSLFLCFSDISVADFSQTTCQMTAKSYMHPQEGKSQQENSWLWLPHLCETQQASPRKSPLIGLSRKCFHIFTDSQQSVHGHCCCSLVAQSGPAFCNPVDCSLPVSSVRGILQERILEWVAMPFSRGSSQPRDRTLVSWIVRGILQARILEWVAMTFSRGSSQPRDRTLVSWIGR